jgi:copper chaperone CopZ
MTCEHCVQAVTEEIGALGGVSGVSVELVAGGESLVSVTSEPQLPPGVVAQALDEAGDYQLAGA